MGTTILGVGELAATAKPGEVLKTFALGSCVGVVLLCQEKQTVGMVHVALPSSKINKERAQKQPGYFADAGIAALLKEMAALGCDSSGKGFVVKIAGGAKILDLSDSFDVGKRNQLAVRKCLWKLGLTPRAEDVGGTISRTMEVSVDTGSVQLTNSTQETWEI